MDDANVVLTNVQRGVDLPQVSRVKQPGSGPSSGVMEVYQGPFPGSVRDPSHPYPLPGCNQIVQHCNPSNHIEVLEAIQAPQRRQYKPGRKLVKPTREDAFLNSPARNALNTAMINPAPVDLRNIMSMWTNFQMNHPVAAKTAKWTAWFIGASVTT